MGSGGIGGLRERWGDGMYSQSSDSDRRLALLRDRNLESREGFGVLSSAEFAELLTATPFEESPSSIERLLDSEIDKVLCDASKGLEPLIELPCREIKERSDGFGENPKDRDPEDLSGKDFGGFGCDV